MASAGAVRGGRTKVLGWGRMQPPPVFTPHPPPPVARGLPGQADWGGRTDCPGTRPFGLMTVPRPRESRRGRGGGMPPCLCQPSHCRPSHLGGALCHRNWGGCHTNPRPVLNGGLDGTTATFQTREEHPGGGLGVQHRPRRHRPSGMGAAGPGPWLPQQAAPDHRVAHISAGGAALVRGPVFIHSFVVGSFTPGAWDGGLGERNGVCPVRQGSGGL